ncbi:hypothetical protein JEM51_06715 [Ligilactobacillus agilis]|uniref:hypothetical protein n=1 Tax=Ligilactobacillus agilis TaxID=1601 RepID=UPI00191FD406|nr:hypothetical protein [Ligilactobacillus agilis]MBL1056114.1 hypothetical protein [Ligilactobacillus agilis]
MAWIKRKHRASMALEDETFLLLEWGKDFNDKSEEVLKVIKKLDQAQEENKRQTLIEKTLPYLTFGNAEALFSNLKADLIDNGDVEQIKLARLQVCYREQGEKEVTTKNEAFIKPFIIDHNYNGILKALIEEVLNSKRFNDIEYEDKRDYFDKIYFAYSSSTGISSELLPIFPSEAEVKNAEGKITVEFPEKVLAETPKAPVEDHQFQAEIPVVEPTEVKPDAKTQSTASENNELSSAIEAEAASEVDISSLDLDEVEQQIAARKEGIANTDNTDNVVAERESNRSRTTRSQGTTTVTLPPLRANETEVNLDFTPPKVKSDFIAKKPTIKFPRFEEARWSKAFQAHEAEYVQWKLDQKRSEFNLELAQKEEQNQRLANQAADQQLQSFEQVELEALNHKYEKLDHRADLKQSIVVQVRKQQDAKLEKALTELNQAEKQQLTTLKNQYEHEVAQTKSNYDKKRYETATSHDQATLKLAQDEYAKAYYDASAKLQADLNEDLTNLAQNKLAKQSAINQQLEAVGETVGQTYYKQYKAELSKFEAQYQAEHRLALKRWLSNTQTREQLAQSSTDAKKMNAQIVQLQQERDNLNQVNSQLRNAVLDEKKKAVDEKINLLSNLSSAPMQTLTEQKTSSPNSEATQTTESPKKSNSSLKKVLLFTASTLVFSSAGVAGYAYHQQTQAKLANLNRQVVKVQQTNDNLSKNQTQLEKEKSKAQSKVKKLTKEVTKLQSSQAQSSEKQAQASASSATSSSAINE